MHRMRNLLKYGLVIFGLASLCFIAMGMNGAPSDEELAQKYENELEETVDFKISGVFHSGNEAKAIANALKKNSTVRSISLDLLPFDQDAAVSWANALKVNTSLTSLSLTQMRVFGDDEVKHLSKSLESNCTLTSLDLFNNKITDEGVRAIAEALKKNPTIIYLNLSQNNNLLSIEGYRVLNDLLNYNCSIKDIVMTPFPVSPADTSVTEETKLEIEKIKKRLLCNGNEESLWCTDKEIIYCTANDNIPNEIIVMVLGAYRHVRI